DVGCGWGHTALELAPRCRSLVAIEPNPVLADYARKLALARGDGRVRVERAGIEELPSFGQFDLVMLDNVLEHIPDQPAAFASISAALRSGGVAYLIVPNKLWPIEAHYHLPFLAYLPLSLANAYLRLTGRGRDYRDASYAPTLFRLRRLASRHPELTMYLVPPADPTLAQGGDSPLYAWGTAALRRFPALWLISKVFLVLLVKQSDGAS
ncbi:MAG TPA: class I SAM-dependent methyltransferase, partial [Thermoanaerobaculia bacterium]|nr:class I SAM-dependent methyltransferase [Thermoanaerobaculia bacterium]